MGKSSNILLKVGGLKVAADTAADINSQQILKGVSLELQEGKTHALMGPNGSGKTTFAQVVMGHPAYSVNAGQLLFEGKSLLGLEPNERALKGIFLSFQYPNEIPGVTVSNYLRMIHNKRFNEKISPVNFRKVIKDKLALLQMSGDFLSRYLNEGFSGGEKKRMEILQLLVLQPKLAILDETDSGLDIDAIKVVSEAVNFLKSSTNMTVLIITHYTRILKYIEPDIVFVMQDGIITRTGGDALANELEDKGYAPFGE